MNILLPVTDNCPSWISQRGEDGQRSFFMLNLTDSYVAKLGFKLKPKPQDLQSDVLSTAIKPGNNTFHTCLKIWTSLFDYLLICKNCWMIIKQYRPWSEIRCRVLWCLIWVYAAFSGLFVLTCRVNMILYVIMCLDSLQKHTLLVRLAN